MDTELERKAKSVLGSDDQPFNEIIADLMSPSSSSVAETILNLAIQADHDTVAFKLSRLLASPDSKMRAMAAILLRQFLTNENSLHLEHRTESFLKTQILQRLAREDDEAICDKICFVVLGLASVYFPGDKWPEFWPSVLGLLSVDSTQRQNKSAFIILWKFPPDAIESVVCDGSSFSLLHGYFSRKLDCNSLNLQFHLTGVEALLNIIKSLSTSSDAELFKSCLSHMIEPWIQDLRSEVRQEADRGLLCLQRLPSLEPTLFLLVFLLLYNLTNALFQKIGDYDLDIDGDDEDCNLHSKREKVILTLVELSELFPDMVKAIPHFISDLFSVFMKALSSSVNGNDSPGSDETALELVNATFVKPCLERFSLCMGADSIGPLAYDFLSHYSDSFSWKENYASLIALSSISTTCFEVLKVKHVEVVAMLKKLYKHTHLWVRWAVLDAILHLSLVMVGPVLALQHHEELFQLLLNALSDSNTVIKVHGLAALDALVQNCSPDTMLLHLDTLVQDLLDLLKDEPELLAETVVQTLTTVIVSSGEHFKSYYFQVMQSLKDMNRVEFFSTELCMYSNVCIFRMKDCVRKNRFMDDAKELIDTFQAHYSTLEADDPKKYDMDEVWVSFCLGLGIEYSTRMDGLISHWLEKAQVVEERLTAESKDRLESDADQRLGIIIKGEERLEDEANIVFVGEQALVVACQVFSRLATVFEGDFHPWIEKVGYALVGLIKLEGEDQLREAVALATMGLLRSAKLAVEKERVRGTELNRLCVALVEALEEAVDKEEDKEISGILKEALKEARQWVG